MTRRHPALRARVWNRALSETVNAAIIAFLMWIVLTGGGGVVHTLGGYDWLCMQPSVYASPSWFGHGINGAYVSCADTDVAMAWRGI